MQLVSWSWLAAASWESVGSDPRLQFLGAGNFSWTPRAGQKDKVHGHNTVGCTFFFLLLLHTPSKTNKLAICSFFPVGNPLHIRPYFIV